MSIASCSAGRLDLIASIIEAIHQGGFDMVNVDVKLTADRVPVLYRDPLGNSLMPIFDWSRI